MRIFNLDIVEIIKCKPISKNKHWKIIKVIGQDLTEIVEAAQKKTAEETITEVMPEEETEEPSDVSLPAGKAGIQA